MGGKKRVTPASRSVRDTSDRKLAPSLYAKVEQIIDVSLTSEWDDEEAVQRDEAEREQALAALASNDLARLARRLAAVAAGHGTSDRWQTWLDVMRTAGWSDEGSLASLNETQEYSWFAQWCLTVGQLPELGIEAYERAMADPQGNDLNWFSNQIFFETLLQKGQDRRLEAACDLLAKTKGMTRVGRAYLAATKLRRGAVDDGKRELFALEGVMDEAIVVASVALAWHHGGLEHEAERILLTLNRSAVFNPALEATLDATFGELFARAVARPEPPPRKPRQSSVSFVLRRATRQTPHHFGPEQRDDAPHCHGCERPLISWIRLDIQACRNLRKALPDWGNFEALACLDCNAWMGRHDYRIYQTVQHDWSESCSTTRGRWASRSMPTRHRTANTSSSTRWVPSSERTRLPR